MEEYYQYYQYYTLDYMAEKDIRIKPKDEEEAKQVIAYLYKAGYHWRAGSKEIFITRLMAIKLVIVFIPTK